jgi:hypothetical protein
MAILAQRWHLSPQHGVGATLILCGSGFPAAISWVNKEKGRGWKAAPTDGPAMVGCEALSWDKICHFGIESGQKLFVSDVQHTTQF